MIDYGALVIIVLNFSLASLVCFAGYRKRIPLLFAASAPAWSFSGIYVGIFLAGLIAKPTLTEGFRLLTRIANAGNAIVGLAIILTAGYVHGFFKRNHSSDSDDLPLAGRSDHGDYLASSIFREHQRAKREVNGRSAGARNLIQVDD